MARTQQHRIAPFLLAIVLIGTVWVASSNAVTDCNNPLFIERSGSDGNVVIIFDNSGSMNEAMYHPGYDPNITYTGDFSSTKMYYVSSSGTYTPDDFDSDWPNSPSADLVDSDGGTSGRYRGNYMNWVYYHATPEQRAALPQVTRIQVAKVSIIALVDRADNVRFGVYGFDYDLGGRVFSKLGTDKETVKTSIQAIVGDSWTPLAETLQKVTRDFEYSGSGAPIEVHCQKNFVIVVTDGYPTKDRNVHSDFVDYDNDGNDPGNCASIGAPYSESNECSDHLDDVAAYLFNEDLRSDLENKQNAITYTIGFTLDAPILQDTADNGGGLYFNADDSVELVNSLTSVLNDIISKKSSGTAVSVVSAENASGNRVYRAKFKPGEWRGFLEAFDLPYHANDQQVWEAGQNLANRDPATRKIYTSVDGTSKIVFDLSKHSQIQPHLNTTDSDSATDVIEFTRGHTIAGYRDRGNWKLGDIVNSSPIAVGPPAHFYDYLDYPVFRNTWAGRDPVIYIGANDGMIHCFRTLNGVEKWSYIPKNQLGNLKTLMDPGYCHSFYVNLTPKVFDAHVGGSWKTILLAGQREGGSGLTALDITDPESAHFTVMWDVDLPILKHTWAIPELARDINQDRFVAVIGSGPDPSGEAHLVKLDLEDGSILWSDALGTASANLNMATSPIVFDRDFDGYDDVLYVADLAGNLWRYDLTTSPWHQSLLFATDQPIQASPIMTIDEYDNVLLYFGTGRYVEETDIDDTSLQTFYCVIDNHSETTITRSNMADQTTSINQLASNDRGWYIDLVEAPGERVTRPDALAAGTVYFTSFQPNAELCRAGGQSWLYTVDFQDGSAADNDDGSENDTTDDRVESLGDGIHSDPILDLANEDVIIQSTNTDLIVKDTKGNILRVIVRSWRQLFQ